MKTNQAIVLFVVVALAALIANLVTLKIAATQVQSQLGSSPTLTGLLGLFSSGSGSTTTGA
jgi:hypothetical protein